MALITQSKKQLIERIKRHIANDFPSADFSTSDNEVLLYIDQAIATTIVGQSYMGAKIEGALVMPEAWLITYELDDVVQDRVTREWYSTLPQPPLSLPLGYSITDVWGGTTEDGKSYSFFPAKAKRNPLRKMLPQPSGVSYRVENQKIYFSINNNGGSLVGITIYVQMPSTRTTSLTDEIAMPDDAIEVVFTSVVAKLKDRLNLPKDIIQDDLSAGNKAS